MPAYMTLDAQYGLMDDNMVIGSTTTSQQTVEQEFQEHRYTQNLGGKWRTNIIDC